MPRPSERLNMRRKLAAIRVELLWVEMAPAEI
jgi:hypothetical protein